VWQDSGSVRFNAASLISRCVATSDCHQRIIMKSYDYAHRQGVEEIDWQWAANLARKLAEALAGEDVEVVVGIARAGLIPATTVACMLRCDLFPVRVTRRSQDVVIHERPVWKVDVAPDVAGKVVAVIDEMADTGETLALVAARVRELGAAHVMTASLVAHSWATPMPDHVALTTDALVIFPWDKEVFSGGRWQLHPEIVAAVAAQENQGGGA
jgi:hypoxanthine phosphoribosyltransferase